MTKRYCIAEGCLNTHRNLDVTFFRLPSSQKDTERRQKWLELLGREDLIGSTTDCRVCSAHFDTASIKVTKTLIENAYPTRLLAEQMREAALSETPDQPNDTTLELLENTESVSSITPSTSRVKSEATVKYKEVTKHTKTQTNDPDLSSKEGMPRKRKLSDESKDCNGKCNTLSHDVNKIKIELEIDSEPITYSDPDNDVTRRLQNLIEWRNITMNKYNGKEYDSEYKLLALNLHYASPLTYRCLQTLLKLPPKSKLNRLKINIPPTLDNRVLDSLALKMKSLPDAAKYCTICIDETTLKRNLYYNIKADEVIGFHNVNGETSPEIASHAYLIMLRGIYVQWKQPLAYALLATTKHYEEIYIWMNEVISKVTAIGIRVKAIVSDPESNFDKFAKEIKKITVKKPYFMHNDLKIYYVFDVPHLVTSMWNNMLSSDFFYGGKKISWDYVVQLYEDQKTISLRLIPKISDAHIRPDSFETMNVKLAAQVLSRTVSAALHTYIDLGKLPEDARPTAEFIESMNHLFDILNSSKMESENKFQTAFRLSEDQKTVLNSAKDIFAGIKVVNRNTGKTNTGHKKSFENFLISIQSIIMLYEDLQKDGFQYLLTRRLNRDNLEVLLSSVQRKNGSCTDPTPYQFQRAFSKLFVRNMVKNASIVNCETDICDMLLRAEDITKTHFTSKDSLSTKISPISLHGETDYRIDLPDGNTITYVSAYLFFKCANRHKCHVVDQILKSKPTLHKLNLFRSYKAYNKKSKFRGKLKMPPKQFTQYIKNLETVFTENVIKCIQNNPGRKLLQLFRSVPPETPCSCFPVDYLLKLFARFRIYTTIKFNNIQFIKSEKSVKEHFKINHL